MRTKRRQNTFCDHGGNGEKDHAEDAEKLESRIHGDEHEKRVHPDAGTQNFGFQDLAQNGNDGIKNTKTDRCVSIAHEESVERQGEQNGSCSEDGQAINEGGQKRKQKRIAFAKNDESEKKLREGEKKENKIRTAYAEKRFPCGFFELF